MKESPGRRVSWEAGLRGLVRGARRVAVLGIGNLRRNDDGAGVRAAREIRRGLGRRAGRAVLAIEGHEVPESLTGRIRAFGPDLVVLIDAAAARKRPGTVFLVEKGSLAEEIVSSHVMPLGLVARYIEETMGARIAVLGIQPASLDQGETLSPAVAKAVTRVAARLLGILKEK